MATTYKWSISAIDTAVSEEGLSNVAKTIHWRLLADNGTHVAESYSSVSLSSPEAETFVEFDDLTEEIVVSWLEAKLDVNALKASLDAQLEKLANPPMVTKSAPWLTSKNA